MLERYSSTDRQRQRSMTSMIKQSTIKQSMIKRTSQG